MDRNLEELVNATRRLGRPTRNQRFPGAAARFQRGERLLKSIRKCDTLPQPRIIPSSSTESEPRPDIFTALSGFGHRLAKTLEQVSTRPLQRHFTPVVGVPDVVIKRRTSRRKSTGAESYGSTGPDRHAQKLALAGVATICFFAVGVILLTASSDQGMRSRVVARQKLQLPPPATEPATEPATDLLTPEIPATPFSQTAIAGNILIDDVK